MFDYIFGLPMHAAGHPRGRRPRPAVGPRRHRLRGAADVAARAALAGRRRRRRLRGHGLRRGRERRGAAAPGVRGAREHDRPRPAGRARRVGRPRQDRSASSSWRSPSPRRGSCGPPTTTTAPPHALEVPLAILLVVSALAALITVVLTGHAGAAGDLDRPGLTPRARPTRSHGASCRAGGIRPAWPPLTLRPCRSSPPLNLPPARHAARAGRAASSSPTSSARSASSSPVASCASPAAASAARPGPSACPAPSPRCAPTRARSTTSWSSATAC